MVACGSFIYVHTGSYLINPT